MAEHFTLRRMTTRNGVTEVAVERPGRLERAAFFAVADLVVAGVDGARAMRVGGPRGAVGAGAGGGAALGADRVPVRGGVRGLAEARVSGRGPAGVRAIKGEYVSLSVRAVGGTEA